MFSVSVPPIVVVPLIPGFWASPIVLVKYISPLPEVVLIVNPPSAFVAPIALVKVTSP